MAEIISQLDGYLRAVRDMNDDHVEKRYWFWADMINIKNRNVIDAIKGYLKEKEVIIKEIDLGEELAIIKSYILENYLLGASNPISEEEKYIKNIHGWRIQEYILMAADYNDDNNRHRWAVEIKTKNTIETKIFVKIKKKLIIMCFLKQLSSE